MPREPGSGATPCVVAVLREIEARSVAEIESVDPQVRVVRVTARDTWLDEAPDAEVIVGFRPLREGALRARKLRWVHAIGAGVENLCEDVAGTDIRVTNNHIHGDSIAEHVFALILAHTRRLREVFDCQAARRWAYDDLLGGLLAGRTMGILGLGTIGRQVARRAAAFGMRVVGTKRRPEPVPGVERVGPPQETAAVLRQATVLVLTLPLTPATRGTLGAAQLALLPEGAFVVNVGRGGLLDEAALVDALRTGRLAGAGLDVFADEPLPESSPLWGATGVIITPHVAGDFPGYMDHMVAQFCENLRRYLAGRPLQNTVDLALGY